MQWLFVLSLFGTPYSAEDAVKWEFSEKSRPPIIEVSRSYVSALRTAEEHLEDYEPPTAPNAKKIQQSVEPPLLVSTKTCLCSPACVCGCNEGRPCQCGSPIPIVNYSSAISNDTGVGDLRQEVSIPMGPRSSHLFLNHGMSPIWRSATPSTLGYGAIPNPFQPARSMFSLPSVSRGFVQQNGNC